MYLLPIQLSLLLVVFILTGCQGGQPSANMEWQSNEDKIIRLAQAFPAFRPALDEIHHRASLAKAQADELEDQYRREQALLAANSLLECRLVQELESLQTQYRQLEIQKAALKKVAAQLADKPELQQQLAQTREALARLDTLLQTPASSVQVAHNNLQQAMTLMADNQTTLTSVLAALQQ